MLMIVRPPGLPVTSNTSSPRVTMTGVIELSIRFPGSMDVGRRSNLSFAIGHARLGIEVAHLVVEQESRATNDDSGTVGVLQGVGVGYRHS